MQYQVMPSLTAEEYEALKADIAERGVQVPVERDEEGNILDGYHRVRACEELGIQDWPEVIRQGLTEEEKILHAYALNLHRRHLTKEQRVQVEADLRQRGWSYRRIGEAVGVDHRTVMHDLSGGENSPPGKVVGADGKVYRSDRPHTVYHLKEAEAPAPELQPSPAKVEADFGEAPAKVEDSPIDEPAPAVDGNGTNGMAVHYSSERMDWVTPQDFFDRLNDEFGFTLDVCATDKTAKCPDYFTPETDGLEQSWDGICWMNPPYGTEIAQWMRKAYTESRRGATVVCLVPSRTDTNWWHAYAMKAKEIRFVIGRLRFDGAEASAPFPSAVVVLSGETEGPPAVSGMKSYG